MREGEGIVSTRERERERGPGRGPRGVRGPCSVECFHLAHSYLQIEALITLLCGEKHAVCSLSHVI